MKVLHKLVLLSSMVLAAASSGNMPEEAGNGEGKPAGPGATADLSNAPRVSVDKPVVLIPLYERDKRIHNLTPFQSLVDAAPAGSVLKPKPGVYAGPVHLTKPLIIEGGGQVTIDGGDKGTVFVLETNGATVRGLRFTGSGESHDSDDGCLNVRGNGNTIESNVLDNCLFGIDLKQSSNNLLKNNKISSKPVELGQRGDGLRLWYSMHNLVEGNEITDSRDSVAWYSNDNVFRNNVGRRSRYSFHFMFAHRNEVVGNRFYDNAVGVYLMYTEGVNLRNNVISHANGAAGMAIGFKEASDSIIEGNEIIYCAIGIGSDLSPFQPDMKIYIRNNRIAYNGIGILFNSELGGNIVTDNTFEGNLSHVSLGGHSAAGLNQWHGKYWDDYQGFDRNGDGIGDNAYDYYAFADRLWMEVPAARFFKNAPAMELLDFLERLAPFSTPDILVHDPAPRFTRPERKGS